MSRQMQMQMQSTNMSDPKSINTSKVVIKIDHLKDNLRQKNDSKFKHIPRE